MSRTPIEIVRDYVNGRQDNTIFCPHKEEDALTTALASVLRDAERFAALERAHQIAIGGPLTGWCRQFKGSWVFENKPLSELADRLREETK